MTTTLSRASVAIIVATAFTAAHAEYRCDPAPNWVDRAACQAAREGPHELRRFVEAMNSIRISIRFEDYVNLATAQSWEQRLAAQKEAEALKVARKETR